MEKHIKQPFPLCEGLMQNCFRRWANNTVFEYRILIFVPEACPNYHIIPTSLMAAPHEGKSAEMIPLPANNGVCEVP